MRWWFRKKVEVEQKRDIGVDWFEEQDKRIVDKSPTAGDIAPLIVINSSSGSYQVGGGGGGACG